MVGAERRASLCQACLNSCAVKDYLHFHMLANAHKAGSTLDVELADKANDLLSTYGLSATTWAEYPVIREVLELTDVLLAWQIARDLGCTVFPYLKIS